MMIHTTPYAQHLYILTFKYLYFNYKRIFVLKKYIVLNKEYTTLDKIISIYSFEHSGMELNLDENVVWTQHLYFICYVPSSINLLNILASSYLSKVVGIKQRHNSTEFVVKSCFKFGKVDSRSKWWAKISERRDTSQQPVAVVDGADRILVPRPLVARTCTMVRLYTCTGQPAVRILAAEIAVATVAAVPVLA
ncbi:hypothetical protein AGLY_009776 [Aphis glycines]|uniref:Uncharacterized protein n=1 Tax=Aphis glycines TaxID=307491 RepID=A0A6G0TI35_APHGL|nr:hypothetical protein AGLY_009776 [Aphis glycines]